MTKSASIIGVALGPHEQHTHRRCRTGSFQRASFPQQSSLTSSSIPSRNIMNVVRKRCGTCNSLRDCCCKGRVREMVLIKSARIPEHLQTLSAEGRRAQHKREQAAKQHGALSQGSGERPNARSGAHWPAEHVYAQPPKKMVALRKEELNGLRHLTAEGRRTAQMQLPKAEQPSHHTQGSDPRRSDRLAPAEHESVRLRHEQQHRQQSDAESKIAETLARQEKFAAEQHQVNICIPSLASCRSSCSLPCLLPSCPVNAELDLAPWLAPSRLPWHTERDHPTEDAACDRNRSGLVRRECRTRAPIRLEAIWSSCQLSVQLGLWIRRAGQIIRSSLHGPSPLGLIMNEKPMTVQRRRGDCVCEG